MGSHSFTWYTRTIPAFTLQPQGVTALWLVLIPPTHKGLARLSWVYYIIRLLCIAVTKAARYIYKPGENTQHIFKTLKIQSLQIDIILSFLLWYFQWNFRHEKTSLEFASPILPDVQLGKFTSAKRQSLPWRTTAAAGAAAAAARYLRWNFAEILTSR